VKDSNYRKVDFVDNKKGKGWAEILGNLDTKKKRGDEAETGERKKLKQKTQSVGELMRVAGGPQMYNGKGCLKVPTSGENREKRRPGRCPIWDRPIKGKWGPKHGGTHALDLPEVLGCALEKERGRCKIWGTKNRRGRDNWGEVTARVERGSQDSGWGGRKKWV